MSYDENLFGVNTDIKLSRSEEKFNMLFEYSPVGMALIKHSTGEFVEVNKSLLKSTGYTKDEFLKLSFWDITPREYKAQEVQQMVDLETKGHFGPNEKEYIRKDGTRYPIRIRGFILEDIDGTKMVWGIIEDISNEYKRIFEDLQDAYFQIDLSNKLILVNQHAVKMFGYITKDEMIGIDADKLFFEDSELVRIKNNLVTNNNLQNHHIRCVRKNGSWFWGSFNVQYIKDDRNKIISIEGVIRDITDSRMAQEKLIESENHFKTVLENAVECHFEATIAGKALTANPAFIKLMGYESEDDVINSLTDLKYQLLAFPGEHQRISELIKQKGFVKKYECELKCKNGQIITVLLNATFTKKPDGQVLLHASFEDITDRKSAELKMIKLNQNLQTLSERMILATRAAKLGIWDWNIVDDELVWDDGMYDLYNISREDFAGAYDAWSNHIHPDDKINTEKAIQDTLDGKKEYAPQFRIIWPDGTIRYIRAISKTFYNESGVPVRMVGVNWDITESEKSQQEIEIANNNLNIILNSSLFGVVTISESQEIRWANTAAIKMMGLNSLEDVVGKKCNEYFCTNLDKQCPILNDGNKVDNREVKIKRKDGQEIPVIKSVEHIKINGEHILLETFIDITDTKMAYSKLKEESEKLRALIESTNDMIWVVDNDKFGLVEYNTALALLFQRGFGITLKKGMKPEEMLPNDLVPRWYSMYAEVLEKGAHKINYEMATANRTLELSFNLVKENDKIIGISVLSQDITERINMEKQIESQRDNLIVSNLKLELLLQQSINAISKIGELRDVYTAGHQTRVRDLSCAIAKELGLSEDTIRNISYGALIHDIGKIYIASDILNKPGQITSLEYQILQTHAEQGYNVIKDVDFPEAIPEMIYQHHERLDGTGYPRGLKADQIRIESRILAVADVVEAMTSHRPYRPALGIDAALDEIKSGRGIKFDADVVDICIKLFEEVSFSFALDDKPNNDLR